MDKITPKYVSELDLKGLRRKNFKFSRVVWWYKDTLFSDLQTIINKDEFLYDFKHNDAFFVFDHSMDPLFQHNFLRVAKDLINFFTTHNIDLKRIIVLSPVSSKFFYKSFFAQNYVKFYPSHSDAKLVFHISYNSLWEPFQLQFSFKRDTTPVDKVPDKHFLSLNRRDSLNRRFLNYSLHKENLFKFGYVSHQRVLEHLRKGYKEHVQEIKILASRDDFDVKCFLKYGYKKHFLDDITNKPYAIYNFNFHEGYSTKSCFEVVTETDIHDSLVITEKTLKPIINKSPFLLCGSYLSLHRLKKFGFETFDSIFDESYDSEPVYYDRMQIIIDNLKSLCSMSVAECHKKLNTVREVCEFNHHHFLNGDWSFKLDTKIQKRIDEVLNV